MSALPPHAPGALPVGRLDALPPLSGLAVRALRRWCEAGEGALALDLREALGPERGEAAAQAFGRLCALLLAAARRPLLRHGPACLGLGADEAAFAEFLRLAAGGEREDALMLACCLVRPDLAPSLVHQAEQAGLRLARAVAATLH